MSDEQEPKLTPRQKMIRNLNNSNHEMLARISKMTRGQVEIDPTGGRMEMFFEKLIEWGVITSDQMEEFNLAWVDHFNSYLMQRETEIREALKEAQRRSSGIATPGSPGGLIVPGHHRRQNGTGRRGQG